MSYLAGVRLTTHSCSLYGIVGAQTGNLCCYCLFYFLIFTVLGISIMQIIVGFITKCCLFPLFSFFNLNVSDFGG